MKTERFAVEGGSVVGGDPAGAEAYLAAAARELGRRCSDCSLCCKVLDIPEIPKPADQWCTHCKPGHGCTIYESRPLVCRGFACQWLVDGSFGDEWRPTKSKMVMRMVPYRGRLLLYVTVDPAYPGAWRRSPYYQHLKDRSTRITVQINLGRRRILVEPSRETEFGEEETVLIGPGLPPMVVPNAKASQLQKEFNAFLLPRLR